MYKRQVTAGLLTIAVIGAVVLTRTVLADDQLDDLEPASMDLPPVAPHGGNDSDLAELKEGSDPSFNLGDDEGGDA